MSLHSDDAVPNIYTAKWWVVRMNQDGAKQHPLGHEGMTFIVERFIPHRTEPRKYIAQVRDYRFPAERDGQLWAFTVFQLQPHEYEVLK